MSYPKVIGLAGKAGAGKDTVADHLVLNHGYVKYSLAAALKAGLNAMFGFTPEQWNDREWKETVIPWLGKSPRQLAQTLGTEWGRNAVRDDLWLLLAQRFIEQSDQRVVIADVRFENEAMLVRNLGGKVWQIQRPDVAAVATHASEKPLAPWFIDTHVFNDSGYVDLFDQVDKHLSP